MGNNISFHGHLGQDAVLKDAGQSRLCEFSVGNNVGFGDRAKTNWFKCKLWGNRGEKIAGFLKKGQLVFVSGELTLETYEKKDGGGQGSSLEVNVQVVDFLGKKDSAPSDRPAQERPAAQQQVETSEDMPF